MTLRIVTYLNCMVCGDMMKVERTTWKRCPMQGRGAWACDALPTMMYYTTRQECSKGCGYADDWMGWDKSNPPPCPECGVKE